MRTQSNGGPPRFALAVLVLFIGWIAVAPAGATDDREAPYADAELPRAHDLKADSPDISGIDASTPTCYRAAVNSETCFVEWSYLYVTAGNGQYIINMKIEIDGRVRAFSQGFFQTYMYIPADMVEPGFAVPCGLAGAAGAANLGNLYSYLISALDSAGQTAISSGSLYCPYATIPIFSDGFESGDISAW